MTPSFETDRLTMRPQAIEDAGALHEAFRDEATMRYWSSAPHVDLEQTHAYLAARMDQPGQRGWVMTLKGSDRVIGTLWAGERRTGVSEIGYMLVPSATKQGFAREGVSRLLDLLFREEGHRRVFADTDPDNRPSNALLQSLGFTLEGRLREEWETHIGVRDTLLWGLLADEWNAR